MYRDLLKRTDGKTFDRVATNLFEEANFKDLEAISRDKLKTHPNSVHAHYYLGKVHYEKKQYKQARKSFNKALDCEPHWEESIQPYLRKIDEESKSS